MKLEDQVVRLELSKRLKQLGVKQESVFVRSVPDPTKGKNKDEELVLGKYCEVLLCRRQQDWGRGFVPVSAFTVAALGEMLADGLEKTWKDTYGKWHCLYQPIGDAPLAEMADTEADARAKMLIHLMENKVIELGAAAT